MPSHFKVKEYCPLVFRNLRERFGVDDVDYRESLTRSQPIQIDSSGKSGAQFYQSYDKFFILKSLTSEEIERMHAFLKHYHPVSLLRFLLANKSRLKDRIFSCHPVHCRTTWQHIAATVFGHVSIDG